MLKLKKLSVSIDGKKILKDIDFEFEKGKVYAVMGPNGSGKSTLAATIMGHPAYELSDKSEIELDGEDISEEDADKRAKAGVFLSFQSPLSLTGVNIYQLIRYALDGERDPLEVRKKIQKYAKKLKIKEELLSRSLNEGFSGGEKKKMEVLQAVMLDPKVLFFDEVDTGVDVDAMKTISEFIQSMRGKDKTFVLITHYNRILKYVEPDEVLVIRDGKIVKTGDKELAEKIEKDGYDSI